VRPIGPNPETADLEKSDPRHAAARRLARLSVSEIKLYHEDEVKLGRERKDLWTRLAPDISMAIQTFDKRVDKEVRERFDYLYDEILRQLAEGDATRLGDAAPKPKGGAVKVAAEPPPPQPVAAPVATPEPAARPEPKPGPEGTPAPATPKFNANEITTAAARPRRRRPANRSSRLPPRRPISRRAIPVTRRRAASRASPSARSSSITRTR
jgi:hypothetical protein